MEGRDPLKSTQMKGGMGMVVAELTIIPLEGAEMRPFVDAAVEVVAESGLKYEVEPMGTCLEGELDQVLDTVKRAHRAALDKGTDRLITEIRIDEDRSERLSLEHETKGYR